MTPSTIQRVEYNRVARDGAQGLRVTFVMDFDEETEHYDIFEFWDQEEIHYYMGQISASVTPEFLMCDIRRRSGVPVH